MFIYKQLTKCQHFLLPNFASIIINFYEGLTRGDTRQTTNDKEPQECSVLLLLLLLWSNCQSSRHMWQQLLLPQCLQVAVIGMRLQCTFRTITLANIPLPIPPSCCSFYPEQQTIYANSCTAHRTLLRRAKCKKTHAPIVDAISMINFSTHTHIETLGHSGERQLNN